MSAHEVCVVVDRRGDVVTVERGDAGAVPDDVRSIAAEMLGSVVQQRRDFFYWNDASPSPMLRIGIERVETGATEGAAIVAKHVYELPSGLTRRELDVLTELSYGRSNGEIAAALGMAERTVTTHVLNVLRKLGVDNRTMAAIIAVEQGLVRATGVASAPTDVEPSAREPRHHHATPLRYAKAPLVIGTTLPLVGIASADAQDMLRGSVLAVEEVNARGGIHGRSIALEIEAFDLLDPDDVARALRTLADRGADVLSSGYVSDQAIAHETAAELQLPYLQAGASGRLSERVAADPERYRFVFQVCPSDSAYAPQFVRQMTQLRDTGAWRPANRRLAIVDSVWVASPREPTTQIGIDEAMKVAEVQGWDIGVLPASDIADDFRAAGRRVAADAPAAVLIGHFLVPGAVDFIEGFLEHPSDTLLHAIYAPSVREFRDRLGPRAEGVMWSTVTGTYSDQFASRFVTSFTRRFRAAPGRSHAGTAYDRVHLAANAWMQLDAPRNADHFVRTLRSNVFRGVNGVYHLATRGQTAFTFADTDTWGGEVSRDPSIAQAHLLFQIQQGRQRILAPAPYADAEFRLPPWMRGAPPYAADVERD